MNFCVIFSVGEIHIVVCSVGIGGVSFAYIYTAFVLKVFKALHGSDFVYLGCKKVP